MTGQIPLGNVLHEIDILDASLRQRFAELADKQPKLRDKLNTISADTTAAFKILRRELTDSAGNQQS